METAPLHRGTASAGKERAIFDRPDTSGPVQGTCRRRADSANIWPGVNSAPGRFSRKPSGDRPEESFIRSVSTKQPRISDKRRRTHAHESSDAPRTSRHQPNSNSRGWRSAALLDQCDHDERDIRTGTSATAFRSWSSPHARLARGSHKTAEEQLFRSWQSHSVSRKPKSSQSALGFIKSLVVSFSSESSSR